MGKIFISYRRVDADFAHRVTEKLQPQISGTVFIDRNIDEDDFEQALLRQVHECNVFIIILTENTFAEDRIFQQDDWVRREIALALELDKPIVLAMHKGFAPPHPSKLPANIAGITTKQGISVYQEYFDQAVEKLAKHCVSISNGGIQIREISPISETIPPPVNQQGTRNINVSQDNVTVSGNLHIGDQVIAEKSEARAVIETLKEQRQRLVIKLDSLSHKEKDTRNTEFACGFVILFFFGVVSLTGVNQMLGIAAFIAIFLWIAWRYWSSGKKKVELKERVSTIQQQIGEIDQNIENRRKFISK